MPSIRMQRRCWQGVGTPALISCLWFQPASLYAQSRQPDYENVVYATIEGDSLLLDIYLPVGVAAPPLVVWIHGGAWRSGTKASVPTVFVENGFATASIEYRLSTEARFPAQAHDIKAAIRFLRAEQAAYGFRADRIAIAGSSAGGHLAALIGLSNGDPKLEGTVGDHRSESSDVQAVVSYYGASNLMTILNQSTPHGLDVRRPALQLLLGGLPDAMPEVAQLASPIFYVDRTDPPLLLLHGDQDPQMPINQAHELEGAYRKFGLDVQFHVVHGASHGGEVFYSSEHLDRVLSFLARTLGTQDHI